MDSLGGILVKGLLGNPIIAQFNLFLQVIIETITPTPTQSVLPTQTLTPTVTATVTPSVSVSATPSVTPQPSSTPATPTPAPTPPIFNHGHGQSKKVPEQKTIKITIRYKKRETVSYHKTDDRIVRVMINIVNVMNKVMNLINSVKVRFMTTPTPNPKIKVKRHDD